jgi:hypothetical protein
MTSPRAQLSAFLARYDPRVRTVARAALGRLRIRLPGSYELVYDNYNALAIGFSPTERTSDAVLSVALYPRWASLFFLRGAALPDPERLLRGSGSRVRHVVLASADDLDAPALRGLVEEAISRAPAPFEPRGLGQVVVKSISARQRPRRPA